MYEVIYFSRGGNTMKVAAVIAGELKVKAQPIRLVKSLSENADIFLGSGLYLLRPSKSVRNFIRTHDFQGKRVALFGTSTMGLGIETLWMKRMLKSKGAIITGKYFCPGQLRMHIAGKSLFIRKNRPSVKDLDKARAFVRSINSQIYMINAETEKREDEYENRILSRV